MNWFKKYCSGFVLNIDEQIKELRNRRDFFNSIGNNRAIEKIDQEINSLLEMKEEEERREHEAEIERTRDIPLEFNGRGYPNLQHEWPDAKFSTNLVTMLGTSSVPDPHNFWPAIVSSNKPQPNFNAPIDLDGKVLDEDIVVLGVPDGYLSDNSQKIIYIYLKRRDADEIQRTREFIAARNTIELDIVNHRGWNEWTDAQFVSLPRISRDASVYSNIEKPSPGIYDGLFRSSIPVTIFSYIERSRTRERIERVRIIDNSDEGSIRRYREMIANNGLDYSNE